MTKILLISIAVLVLLAVVLWIGFLVPARPFAVDRVTNEPPDGVPIPAGLPNPVDRYLHAVSLDGETLPRIQIARYSGTGWAKPTGVWIPFRHRATVVPGERMFRVMEFPWYGLTLLHVEDTYIQGVGMTAISGLISGQTTGPHTNQGAFLALIAESVIMPTASFVGGSWEAVDDHRARIVVPYVNSTEELLVAFDPATGLPSRIEAERYKSEDGEKVTWWIDLMDYRSVGGLRVPSRFEVRWSDEGGPWSKWTIDELVLSDSQPTE